LEEIYGAITYYLGHQQDVDSYLRQSDREFEELRARETNPVLHKKLAEAKIERGLAQLDRGEGIPGDKLRGRLEANKAAWLGERLRS
jgi:hypothetical protein